MTTPAADQKDLEIAALRAEVRDLKESLRRRGAMRDAMLGSYDRAEEEIVALRKRNASLVLTLHALAKR